MKPTLKTMRRTIVPSIPAWGSALLLWAVSAAIPPAEQLLPNDTLAVLCAPDWTKASAAQQQAPFSLLWNDPAMRPFRDKFLDKLKTDVVAPLERELGVKLSDYSDLLQGQFTLALTRNGWTGTAEPVPAFLLVLDTRDKAELLRKNLAEVKRKLTDSGRKLRTETIRGVEFTTILIDTGELTGSLGMLQLPGIAPGTASSGKNEPASATAPKSQTRPTIELSVGQAESALLVGTSTRVLEKVLARLTGSGGGALAEVPAFEADARSVLRDGLSYGWIHFAPVGEILAKRFAASPSQAQGEEAPMALQVDKILAALGLTSLKTLAFNARQSPDGEFFDLFLGAPEQTRQGLFKLIATAPKDASPPPFVPADAIQFSRWRADGQRIWAAVETIANEIAPGMLGFLAMQIETMMQEKDPAFDFKKNLIGNLGDDIVSYQKAPKGTTFEDLSAAPSLTLLASPNPEQFLQGIKSVLSMALAPLTSVSFKEREFLGRKIHSLPLPTMPVGDASKPVEQSLHLTSSAGYLALSTDAALVEEYLRSGETKPKPLAATPGLAEAAEKVGGMATGLFGYQNDLEDLRILTEILRANGDLIAQALAFSTGGPEIRGARQSAQGMARLLLAAPLREDCQVFSPDRVRRANLERRPHAQNLHPQAAPDQALACISHHF